MVLIEERTTGNMQMVVKDLPVMQRRAVPLPSAKDIV
jgi:hypothetical protein